jgi:acyl transferase domain-containing protein/SAM-dependent methyltransferase/acyl carrier protein
MVTPAPAERLQLPQGPKWWGNFLRDPETFDNRFFKKSSREAIVWDPQQRILLEVAYEALESTGYFSPSSTAETNNYGCYIGAVMNNYYDNISCHPATAYATIGTSRPFLSGSISHHFGWTGPSLTIDSACSSSLVGLHTACRAIWSGECTRALAGGTNIITSPFDYENLQAAGMLSPTGQCKPFDAGADGYCRGEGVAVVILKKLSDAIRDNDTIHGVIVGSAVNQNYNFSHITVPNADSQMELFQKVMKLGDVGPESVSYVEAHGTGTGVGDPVEACSIRGALAGPCRDSTLHFASIKGNIGHTEATAGVAGLIKVLLMMTHGKIPAQAGYTSLNPKIPPIDGDKMEIPQGTLAWDTPCRLAFVNSYGAAGSNSAVLVREKPFLGGSSTHVGLATYPLFISAASASSLSANCENLLEWLRKNKGAQNTSVASLTFNLAERANRSLPHSLCTSVSSIADVEAKLKAALSGSGTSIVSSRKPVVLVVGGQESDFVGLSRDLYQSSKVFREHLDRCDQLLVTRGLESLYPAIFKHEPIKNITTLNAALFAVQFASAMAWISCGLAISGVVGHSFGQLTAFCISGVLSFPDALTLVIERALLMTKHWGAERGAMISVQTERQAVEQALQSLKNQNRDFYAEIACYNGPKNHVVVGSSECIACLERHFTNTSSSAHSIRTKRLSVTHGFHSKYTEAILPQLTAVAKRLQWNTPKLHIETCTNAGNITEPDFKLVSEHMRSPVFFQQAVERLAKRFPQATWLEVGRGSSVLQLVRGSLPDEEGHSFLAPRLASNEASGSLVDVCVNLWRSGQAVQFWPFHRSQKREYDHLSLPPYQFDKIRHWLPFTGRDRGRRKENDNKEGEVKHELISFMQFTDISQKTSLFRIDPRSDRFQTLLSGHVMSDQALAPASLYFEVVARAALLLQGGISIGSECTATKEYVPTIEDLFMKSPIGNDPSVEITLKLQRLEDVCPTWSFFISTTSSLSQSPRPIERSTGKVCLKMRNNEQAARDFQRLESLTGDRRYREVMNHADAEGMQGNHIYRAFSTVVSYGELFRGIKKVACVGHEAAGNVIMRPRDTNTQQDQRLCNAPMIDSFMQFAGFLVNYFNSPNPDDISVCMRIDRIEIGGGFDPDVGEWIVYSTMSEGGGTDASSDAYVFDARSKKLVMMTLGLHFTKMPKVTLARLLKGGNRATEFAATKAQGQDDEAVERTNSAVGKVASLSAQASSSKRIDVLQILSNITDLPMEDIKDDATLDELGVDSLMATEAINDMRTMLGLTIDLTTFLFLPCVGALIDHVNGALRITESTSHSDERLSASVAMDTPSSGTAQSNQGEAVVAHPGPDEYQMAIVDSTVKPERPTIILASDAFEKTRLNYDTLGKGIKANGFWSDVYPAHSKLVLAYVVEAFAKLGCDLARLQTGDPLPSIMTLDKHKRLVRQLHRILEDASLISSTSEDFVRGSGVIEERSAESMYQRLVGVHPQHDDINKLVRSVGSQLASCLKGDMDGLQVVFGDKEVKRTLEKMYEFWPLLRTATLVLGDFLVSAFTNATGSGKFRILEIGAGTGGTTRYIVHHLRNHGINFEYIFTDISPSLVAAARKKFSDVEEMKFEVLDIEKPIKPEYQEAFHCIVATNCVHATRDLRKSLSNIRAMLRSDGALTLIEITKNMFWLDIVVGLFEGWWLFEDDRSHALVDEKHWVRVLLQSGFNHVLWSDGSTPESKTVRVIGAFPVDNRAKTETVPPVKKPVEVLLQTVVYKKIGQQEIHADIYFPIKAPSSNKKIPVGTYENES